MADKKTSIKKKKPVSQKRVAIVLASLVGALTFTAAALLFMEGTGGNSGMLMAMGVGHTDELQQTRVPLHNGAWNCIIIYESGDQVGSGVALADDALIGGQTPNTVRSKADFHFVVDKDGKVTTGAAWRDQKIGTPYAGWPDNRYHNSLTYNKAGYKPVGVCFIGDISRSSISEAEHRSLLQRVSELQELLKIDSKYVFFQWDLESGVPTTQRQKDYAVLFRRSMK